MIHPISTREGLYIADSPMFLNSFQHHSPTAPPILLTIVWFQIPARNKSGVFRVWAKFCTLSPALAQHTKYS